VVVFAILLAIATSSSFADTGLHFHVNVKNTAANLAVRGLISRQIESMIHDDQQHHVDLHLHFDGMTDEEIENFSFGDIIGGIKKGVEEVKKGVQKGVDGVKKGVEVVGKGVKKGFDITTQGINIALKKTDEAFHHVKKEIEKLKLPLIKIPKLIEPIINISKLASKLIPCGMAFKKAAPALFKFAKAAVTNSAADAVEALLGILQYLPDITEKCIGKTFKIPPNVMNKIQCVADIVALAAIVGQFILAPENIIATVSNLTSLIDLIPRTISDCTGAFA